MQCKTDNSGLEKSLTLTKAYLTLVDLLKKNYNAKITEREGKIHSITGLAITATLIAVKNKTLMIVI